MKEVPVDLPSRIRDIVARLARVDADFRADADVFRELGLQSAAALDFLLQLEEEFGVAINDDAFARARTLEQITALVADLRGRAA
jgi:minimal PKS acyl carrier protein